MPQFQTEFGDYPDMFIHLFSEIDSTLQFQVYDLRKNQIPENLTECDAYITTGSRVSTYDSVDWIPAFKQLILDINEAKIKLVGICFGHQLIADCLDGQTTPSERGWGIGISTNDIKVSKSWMQPPLDQLNVVVSHKDQVTRLPVNAEILASSDFCPNFMLQIGEHILTVQGHPEFSKGYSKTLMKYRTDMIGKKRVDQGLDSLSLTVHDKILIRWIYQFIQKTG